VRTTPNFRAVHEGNGEAIAFFDESADEKQREALLRIMTGQDTDPFATMFAVYASTVTTMNAPVFTKIDLELDIDGRKGRVFVKNYIDTKGRPLRNKVTGPNLERKSYCPRASNTSSLRSVALRASPKVQSKFALTIPMGSSPDCI